MSETLRAHLSPLVVANVSEQPSQLPRQQIEVLLTRASPDSINRQLDDMLSTSFNPHIINYESPKGFAVPKFTMYDGMSDPFDHIMHSRQLITLGIGNDALMCKVFSASLHNQALSWFHRFPQNSVSTFQDISKAFVGHYLCSAHQSRI